MLILLATAVRMAMLDSDAHPGPQNLKFLASVGLPMIFQTQSAVIGPPLLIVSVYTWPDSWLNSWVLCSCPGLNVDLDEIFKSRDITVLGRRRDTVGDKKSNPIETLPIKLFLPDVNIIT